MKRTTYCFRKPQILVSRVFLILCIAIPSLAAAQAVPYAGTFAKSKDEVDKALKEMQAYAGQKLPVVDGFVATGDQPLDRFERAFYQFSIDLLPTGSGGTIVRVIAKITAWYADPDPSKSGYQVLPSNGRLELDLLDRLREKLGGKLTAPAARSGVQAPRPKLDLATGSPGNSLPPSRPSVPASAMSPGTTSGAPGDDEVAALRIKRAAEERRMQELNAELQSLQEIQRNQAHPLNLVVVKKIDAPVLARPTIGSHPLFTASANDEFEFLYAEGEWIHVQISGASRGYIRRSNLDLPEFIAARLKSPNGNAANEKLDAFRIEREETAIFPGNWEMLRGKRVKIYTVQPISQDLKETRASAKLNFAASLFQRFSADTWCLRRELRASWSFLIPPTAVSLGRRSRTYSKWRAVRSLEMISGGSVIWSHPTLSSYRLSQSHRCNGNMRPSLVAPFDWMQNATRRSSCWKSNPHSTSTGGRLLCNDV